MSTRPRDYAFDIEDPLDDTYVWRVRYWAHSGRSYWCKYKRVLGRLTPLGIFPPAKENDDE
jgi:hypothetical protein